MKTRINVGDIMTRNYVALSTDASLIDCARMMIKKKVGSVILKESNKLKGIITERDIIWALTKKSSKDLIKIKARDLGKKKIVTIKPSADLYEALQRMKKGNYRWLPVIYKKKIVGFLTLKDILKIEPELFDIVSENLQVREEEEKLKRTELVSEKRFREDICEECGNFDYLYKINGVLMCGSCSDSM